MKLAKRFMALSLSALMALSFAGCGDKTSDTSATTKAADSTTKAADSNGGSDSGKGYEDCEISISWWGGDARHEATIAAIEAFQKKYPGITVKYNYGAWSDWETAMATQFSSGTAPDVNQINWNWIESYSSDGSTFLDLNTVADTFDLTQYPEDKLNLCKVGDSLQAVPVSMTGRIFYWNKTTFDKAGIGVPTTNAELMAAGQTFKDVLGDDYYPLSLGEYDRMICMVYYLESKYGKNWVENGALNYTKEEIMDGLSYIDSLEDNHVMPTLAIQIGDGADSLDKNSKWINGNYAGILEWDSSASKYRSALAEGQEMVVGNYFTDWGSYQGGFTKVSLGFAITANTKHPHESAMLMNYLLNEDEGTTLLSSQRGIPLSAAALANCTSQNLLDEMVAEANSKVLGWCDYQLDAKFEDSSLKGSDGVYYDVFGNLSYDNYTVEQAADALIEGIGTTLSK